MRRLVLILSAAVVLAIPATAHASVVAYAPANGQTYQIGSPITFDWYSSIYDYDDQVQVTRDGVRWVDGPGYGPDTFRWGVWPLTFHIESSATFGVGNWYWRVCVADYDGIAVTCSPVRWFTVVPIPQCQDGVDNDGDGTMDLSDFGCDASVDTDERLTVTPMLAGTEASRIAGQALRSWARRKHVKGRTSGPSCGRLSDTRFRCRARKGDYRGFIMVWNERDGEDVYVYYSVRMKRR